MAFMSIDDLRAFILVATERSVTKAATRLEVSQQSVSERIRRLEGRLGVKLFERRPYGMRPSAAGFQFLTYATQCVELIDQAVAVISDTDLLRVEIQRSVAPAVTTRLDELVSTGRVKVAVSDDAEGESILSSVAAGDIDVGIGVFAEPPTSPARTVRSENGSGHPVAGEGGEWTGKAGPSGSDAEGELDPNRVLTEALFADPVVWAAPPDHPLARAGEPISVSQFFGPGALTGPLGSPAGAQGFEEVRVAARSVLQGEIAAGRLVELTLDQPNWVVPISIAYRANDHDRAAVAAVREALATGAGHSPASSDQPSTSGGAAPGR